MSVESGQSPAVLRHDGAARAPGPEWSALSSWTPLAATLTLAAAVLLAVGAKWASPIASVSTPAHAAALGCVVIAAWLPLALLLAAGARRELALATPHTALLARWIAAAVGSAVLHVAAVEGLLELFGMAGEADFGRPPVGLAAAFRLHFHESLLLMLATAAAFLGAVWLGAASHRGARLGRLARELRVARLDLLRAQLEPHFLFNALNSISAEVQSDPAAADRMICSLSDFLRGTLTMNGAAEVALEQELEQVARYAAVERIRFGARLELRVVADPAARRHLVPPLILQPLVENAVRHGVARSLKPVRIEIRAECRGGTLRIAVLDDAETPAAGPSRVVGSGVGLSNVRGRLSQLYGDAAGLVTRRREERGFEAVVELPARTGEDVGAAEPLRRARRGRRWRRRAA